MKSREDDSVEVSRADLHERLVQDLTLLHDSRIMLAQRLERVIVALALTLDAEVAAEQRLAQLQDGAGARRIGARTPEEWARLAQRYREVIRALESINEQALDGRGSVR
jgi:hypothetical protein